MTSFVGKLLNRTPVPYVSRHQRSHQQPSRETRRSDQAEQLRAMELNGTIFSIVNRTSNSFSQVNWRLLRKAVSGRAEDRVEVTRHAALDLWHRPNPFYTGQEFRETFQQHVDLTGLAWWVLEWNRSFTAAGPLAMWPVRPDRIYAVPDPEDFIAGYVYLSPDGQKVPLEVDEVLQLKMPNPLDPFTGLGPVQAVDVELDSARYASEYNRNFFLNGAEPGGVIELPERLGDQAFDELRERWNEQHRGVSRAHRVAILETARWVDRKYTMRDMQFTELRTVTRDALMEAYGISKHMLGITEDVNRANAEAGEALFARHLTQPRCVRVREVLNFRYLPLFGATATDLEFDFDNPVPEDRELESTERTSKASAAKDYVDAGYDPEDVTLALDLPPMRYVGPPRQQPGVGVPT